MQHLLTDQTLAVEKHLHRRSLNSAAEQLENALEDMYFAAQISNLINKIIS